MQKLGRERIKYEIISEVTYQSKSDNAEIRCTHYIFIYGLTKMPVFKLSYMSFILN